jgi:DNA-binding response OmpR family regulator
MTQDRRDNRQMEDAAVLLMEPSEHGLAILVQIVARLGVKRLYRCESLNAAREIAESQPVTLAILDVCPPQLDTYAFVRWMRRNTPRPTCRAPVLLTASDTPSSHTQEIFSCGADALVRKPIAPSSLTDRILWAMRSERQFVVTDTYVGPERRTPERLAADAAAAAAKAAAG